MYCPSCNAANVEGAPFCASCGCVLSGTPAEPVRKGLARASLVLGLLSIPTLGCLGIGALVAVILGIVALVRASREPQLYGGKGLALGGIVSGALSVLIIFPIAIVAAIAIPSVLRARLIANESAAIGDIRAVMTAEAAFASVNGGFYDTPRCLGRPGECLPGYSGPVFLDETLAGLGVKNGYQRRFHAGPPAVGVAGARSPSSLQGFAYTAVPVAVGRTGQRAFCGDASGAVCMTAVGDEPEVIDGACAPSCVPLQ
jgi:type IV pilus assembly protein PilA